jgi:Transposase IS4
MMKFLHVCSLSNQPSTTDVHYDPSYKVKELLELLEERYHRLFVAGKNLSLDETLIRAFGLIKFKVRIITKSARYGLKLYVITDAETAFVLRTIIYTGTHTYYDNDNDNTMKTVAVVKQLCLPFEGSHRTVFINRFYTLLDLLKELDKMNLYVTGTVMRNRLPKELTIAKASREFVTAPSWANIVVGSNYFSIYWMLEQQTH